MLRVDYGNLRLLRFNNNANTEAAIITHGGYTPAGGSFRTGSGKATIPTGLTLELYAPADTVCIGTAAYWKVSTGTCTNQPAETLPANSITENYSLTHDEKMDSWNFNDNWQIDIFMVSKKKAHLNDILKIIEDKKLPYTTLHAFFCRVNKSTWTGNIG